MLHNDALRCSKYDNLIKIFGILGNARQCNISDSLGIYLANSYYLTLDVILEVL